MELLPHTSHTNPWELHQRDKPPKCLALKTNGSWVQEKHKDIGNKDSTFKELTRRPICPKMQHKSSNLKRTYTLCDVDSLTNKASALGAEIYCFPVPKNNTGRCHFYGFPQPY